MSFKNNNQKSIVDIRAKITLWLSLIAIILLPPFCINNFVQERYLLGIVSLILIIILCAQALTIYRGYYFQRITAWILTPAILFFLTIAFLHQKIVGAFWCYPAVIVFYFILPKKQAIFASLCLLLISIPCAFWILEPAVAIRFAVTLLVVAIFSATFVIVILQQQLELERKEVQLRDSMASASHELLTPIATLVAQIEAMKDGLRPLNIQQLSLLGRSAEYLTELVNDLSVLSLADVNSINFELTLIDISTIVSDSIQSAKIKLAAQQLTIKTDINKQHLLNGDNRRLRQVIDNLIENCCRYTDKDGVITISVTESQNAVELCVSDTGPGVSEEQLTLIFERFYRVEKSRSRMLGGSGLGLSLVKALVELHGGNVSASHSKYGGLAICISLPTNLVTD